MEINKPKIKKICVICWGLKGDLFTRIPILESIKKEMPWASLTAVVDKNNSNVLEGHPDIDEIYSCNRSKHNKLIYYGNTLKDVICLRRKNFDLIINLYSGGMSNFVIWAIHAKYRIGFNHTKSLRMANNILVETPDMTSAEHWTFLLAHLLKPLDISPSSVRLGSSYFASKDSIVFSRKYLKKHSSNKLVLINLGAGRESRRWPVEYFVNLSHNLNKQFGIIPVVLTNPGMEELTERFLIENNNVIPVVHAPLMSFDKEAAIMDSCYAVITGDTSLMHLAIALKTPTLALFFDTNPVNVMPKDCLFEVCEINKTIYCKSATEAEITAMINYVYGCFVNLKEKIDAGKT